MTAQVLPEPTGPVQLLDADAGAMVPRPGHAYRDGRRRRADDEEDRHLALVSAGTEDISRIRRLAHDFLARLHVPPVAREDALLVISELVTNAIIHALPPAALSVRSMPCSVLRIEVTDGGPQPHLPPHPHPQEEHGRGLSIVAALATRHGTVTHAKGATRWAELKP